MGLGLGFRRVAGRGSGIEEEKIGFGSICEIILGKWLRGGDLDDGLWRRDGDKVTSWFKLNLYWAEAYNTWAEVFF